MGKQQIETLEAIYFSLKLEELEEQENYIIQRQEQLIQQEL